jgi:hypothetical protein
MSIFLPVVILAFKSHTELNKFTNLYPLHLVSWHSINCLEDTVFSCIQNRPLLSQYGLFWNDAPFSPDTLSIELSCGRWRPYKILLQLGLGGNVLVLFLVEGYERLLLHNCCSPVLLSYGCLYNKVVFRWGFFLLKYVDICGKALAGGSTVRWRLLHDKWPLQLCAASFAVVVAVCSRLHSY